MDLEIIEVKKRKKEYKEIKELMIKVFPQNELFPTWLLLLFSKRKLVDFYAYYSTNQEFVGLSYVVADDKMAFILYLAVNDKLQGNGYGSQILEIIKEKYKDKEITLHMECVDKNANNYEQRVKRLHFYQKMDLAKQDIV